MVIDISETKSELALKASQLAARIIRDAISNRGRAFVIAATGASQFEFLDDLIKESGIDWAQTTFFHLDEYVGLPESHPASFRRYLRERIVERIAPGEFHFIDGEAADLDAECDRLDKLISRCAIDVAFVGIGENGHLAFNDPPADFETVKPFLVVDLDEACRRQQFNEGWFPSLEDVPRRAVSMSIRQILKSESIICIVPDARKAEAVRNCFEGDISPLYPASVLRRHARTTVFLDRNSAALLAMDNGTNEKNEAHGNL